MYKRKKIFQRYEYQHCDLNIDIEDLFSLFNGKKGRNRLINQMLNPCDKAYPESHFNSNSFSYRFDKWSF